MTAAEPLTFAPEYKWETYAEVDTRRRAVGSALTDLFSSDRLVAGPDYHTVGLWSVNRPGKLQHSDLTELLTYHQSRFLYRVADC